MNAQGQRILDQIAFVESERQRRQRTPGLGEQVDALKRYQHARFQRTYADLLADPSYRRAAEFFLEDLYGPYDFSARDTQFAKVVPGIVRLFPGEVVDTVEALAELHALTEELDSIMAGMLASQALDAVSYTRAWQQVGREADRQRQIRLVRALGDALRAYTRKPLLRQTLRLMHRPAHAMGLGALQTFLETGFDTFREMRDAERFLDVIESRERTFAKLLFEADPSSKHPAEQRLLP